MLLSKTENGQKKETEIIGNGTENYNIEAKVEELDEINDKQSMDTGHTAQAINEKKTMETAHKAKNLIAVDAQRQQEKITRYARDPTILRKKKTKEKERVKSSDYANASSIRINKLFERETGADLKQNSESHTTEIDDLYNGATTDTKIHSVKVLNSISENVDDSQLVTTIDNRDSSGSDESYHSAHDQCLSLESQEALVKNNVQHNAITTGESIDMKTITSQTNMSFNHSTVNLVINQSN
ncbi:unnamed protein product [Mytilus edulis]|uniref:Uncharacterized protein n=1 Tax=Mytilus edulis TaxID=6550 RepID=A0A8S3RWQ6_MYTED|nr:unnamed protein product [Mytilus edulis]